MSLLGGQFIAGEIASSAMSMDGRIVTVADMAGRPAELRSRVTAHRLGGC